MKIVIYLLPVTIPSPLRFGRFDTNGKRFVYTQQRAIVIYGDRDDTVAHQLLSTVPPTDRRSKRMRFNMSADIFRF